MAIPGIGTLVSLFKGRQFEDPQSFEGKLTQGLAGLGIGQTLAGLKANPLQQLLASGAGPFAGFVGPDESLEAKPDTILFSEALGGLTGGGGDTLEGGGGSAVGNGSAGPSGGLADSFTKNPLGSLGLLLESFIAGSEGRTPQIVKQQAADKDRDQEKRRLEVLEGRFGLEKSREARAITADKRKTKDAELKKVKDDMLLRGALVGEVLDAPTAAGANQILDTIDNAATQTKDPALLSLGKDLRALLSDEGARKKAQASVDRTNRLPPEEVDAVFTKCAAVGFNARGGCVTDGLKAAEERLKGKPRSAAGKLRADFNEGLITQGDLDAGIKKAQGVEPKDGTLVGADKSVKAAVSNSIRNSVLATRFDSVLDKDGNFRLLNKGDRPKAAGVQAFAESLIQQGKATGVLDAIEQAADAFGLPIIDPEGTEPEAKLTPAQEKQLSDAREAVKRGADPEAVKKRLEELGIDPSNL